MGDGNERRPDLPLIPYPSGSREVILQRGSSVVLYDHTSRTVQLVQSDDDVEPAVCPTCHRPYDNDTHEDTQWMSPSYFSLLNHSRDGSIQSSRSPSPQLLLPALRSTSRRRGPSAASVEAGDEDEPRPSPRSRAHHKISSGAFSQGYFDQHFVQVRELGRGGSGVVLQVKHVLDGHDVGDLACKRIPVGDDLPWLTKVLVEVQLLQKLRHPNLVAYMHVWLEHFTPSSFAPSIPHAFILQQYCNGGDLQHYIFDPYQEETSPTLAQRVRAHSVGGEKSNSDASSARRMPFDEVRAIFKDITSGLKYLHANGYVHRDLKPSNCLLHRTEKRLTVLVSDFGETTEANAIRKSSGATGTVSYCAPEVLQRDPRTGRFGNFTEKSDIFSLGLIVHLMAFGKLPFQSADPMNEDNENYDLLREEIASWQGMTGERGSRPDVSDRMRDDLSRLLSRNPDERPSSEDILRALKSNPGIYENNPRPTSSSNRRASTVIETPDTTQYKLPLVEDESRSPRRSTFEQAFEPPNRARTSSTALVRRKRRQSPPDSLITDPEDRPLLLLPPPRVSLYSIVTRLTQNRTFALLAKIFIFGFKVWTVLSPCRPLGVTLAAAFPILGLAAVDLAGMIQKPWASFVLAMLHLVALGSVRHFGVFCDSDSQWQSEVHNASE